MEPEGRGRMRSGAGITLGLFVMALGLLFLLDNLGVVEARQLLRYWPAVFVLIGLHEAMQPRPRGWRGQGSVWIVIGSWLLLEKLGVLHLRLRDVWPVLVILIGGRFVWRGLNPRPRGLGADSGSSVSGLAIMGGVDRASSSDDFQGGYLTAIMGGCGLDLTRARIASGEATIDVFAWWGGIEIRVPEGWAVVSRVVPIMGAFEDNTSPPAESTQRLVISGLVIMGGVEIKRGVRADR